MNARPMLSRIAAAMFRRATGTVRPVNLAALTGNRDRYVHTSVSTDTAHAADNNGDGHATDVPPTVIPFRTDAEGNLLDRMSGEPITRLPLW